MNTPSTLPDTSGSRRLKLLAVILVLSNLLLGAFSVYLIHRTDRDYSLLLDDTVPVLYQVREAGGAGGRAFRALIAAMVTDDPAKRASSMAQAKEDLRQSKILRDQVMQAEFLRRHPDLARELEDAGDAYEREIAAILPRVTPTSTAENEGDSLEKLQEANARYAAVNERVTTAVVNAARITSDDYTAKSHSRIAMLLGFAGWPLLVVAGIATVTILIILTLLFVFRQAGTADGS